MPDPAGLPPKVTSIADRVLTYGLIVIARALPMFGIIIIAYNWKVALVWSVILSVFYDRLNDGE